MRKRIKIIRIQSQDFAYSGPDPSQAKKPKPKKN